VDKRDPRRPRYCKHCQCWKPERSHHCSVSGRCILKMDHYCIWVVNCVGLLNYKFFLQFLWWTLVASAMAVCLLIKPMVGFLSGHPDAAGCVRFGLLWGRGGGWDGWMHGWMMGWMDGWMDLESCCRVSHLSNLPSTNPPTRSAPTAFIVVVMDGAFAAALGGFIGMHYQLIKHGCTTIGARARRGFGCVMVDVQWRVAV